MPRKELSGYVTTRQQDDLSDRLDEQTKKVTLARKRSEGAVIGIIPFDGESQEIILRCARAQEYLARTKTDSLWVMAMLEAGIREGSILNVWEVKDEHERKLRDR